MNPHHRSELHTRSSCRPGVARLDLVVVLMVVLMGVAILIAMMGAGRSRARELASLSNLKTLAVAHSAYAAQWGDRQFTHMPDGMSAAGGNYQTFVNTFGCPPSVILGFGSGWPGMIPPGLWGYWLPCGEAAVGGPGNFQVMWPLVMSGAAAGVGMFQLQNVVGFNEFVNGRFMDPVFYAPADLNRMATVGYGLADPNPFTFITAAGARWQSSYIASPAAMYHPGVFGGDADSSFKSPLAFSSASISPTVSQCAHPDLKSRMTEEYWLQSPPQERRASSTSDAPLFNHGASSVPMTLFFDGHVAPMPIRKVLLDNETVVKGGGTALWMDTEITIGNWASIGGFYSNIAVDDTRTSAHVFTRGGILGRDVITPSE